MSSVKTIATFAIIIGCFAVLYPKFLHPMVTRIFGLQSKSAHDFKDGSTYYPPGRKPDDRPPHHPNHAPGDVRQQIRPGPHPGMRAAAEMHRQQSTHGTGRGMMGIVLPMYAVGIVLYLVYTLVKVFGKKEKSEEGEYSSGETNYRRPPLDPLSPQQKTQQLQNLLLKADDKSISNEEMKELQRRLEETEAQMSQILNAMQVVQNKIGAEVVDKVATKLSEMKKTADSSPDMDSYEFVNKSGKSEQSKGTESKGVESNATTPDVDSIRSEAMSEDNETSTENIRNAEKSADEAEEVSEKEVEDVGAGNERQEKDQSDEAESESDNKGEIIPEKQDSDTESSVRHRQTKANDPH